MPSGIINTSGISLYQGVPCSNSSLNRIIEADFKNVLTSNIAASLFSSINAKDFILSFNSAFDSFLATVPNARVELFAIGVASLYSISQLIFTGPDLQFNSRDLGVENIDDKIILNLLSSDNEDVYHLLPDPLFLLIAKLILVDSREKLSAISGLELWTIRTQFVHQRTLENVSASLYDSLLQTIENFNLELDDKTRAIFELECGLIFHYYKRDKKSLVKFQSAQKYSGLDWSLSGALGKRTKFQTFDCAQLIMVAKSSSLNQQESLSSIPNTLALNDDTLLDKIALTTDATQENLDTLDQCILLAFCLNVKNTNPDDGITSEQMVPFVTRVLENANNWTVHTMGLLIRARLESNKSRTVERSVLQVQALVDQFPCKDSDAKERIMFLFSVLAPAKWELEVLIL